MNGEPIMTPSHPRWREFIAHLEKAIVCFETTEAAEEILTRMGGIDVPASIRALRELGGTCDCEIVYALGSQVAALH